MLVSFLGCAETATDFALVQAALVHVFFGGGKKRKYKIYVYLRGHYLQLLE